MEPDTAVDYAPLVEGTRFLAGQSAHVETFHSGVICVLDGNGTPITGVGNSNVSSPLRSTAKAFQLLPFILDGLHNTLPHGRLAQIKGTRHQHSGLADLAVMMSSHSGEAMHTQRVEELLRTAGFTPAALRCGTHPPLNAEASAALIRERHTPGPLHCNCSGKHANMLLVCKSRRWPIENYLCIEHPLQQRIGTIISILSGNRPPLPHVIDGCSLPTFVLSIKELARLYTHLAYPHDAPNIGKQSLTESLGLLFHAGVTYPEMIAGTGRLDTELMQVFNGQVFAKTGAAGVYAMAIRPSDRYPKGLGIGIKVSDGDPTSSIRRIVAVDALKQLSIPSKSQENTLNKLAARHLTNFRNTTVGKLRAIFKLAV